MAFPTTSVLDNFTRADAATLGANYSRWVLSGVTGDMRIVSNAAKPNATNGVESAAYWNVGTFGPDCEVHALINFINDVSFQTYMALGLRLQDPGGTTTNDGYLVSIESMAGADNVYIFRVDNAVATQLGATVSQEFANGESMGVEMVDSTLTLYRKSGTWSSVTTRTDSTYSGAGYIGLYGVGHTNDDTQHPVWDDFGGGTIEGNAPATKIQFRAAGAQTAANTTPISPALPTGHARGDRLLMFCSQASAAGITFTPPAGWTSIGRNSNATRSMTIEVFEKIDNGSETDPSVAVSAATAGWTVQIGAWYNIDEGTLLDATAVSSDAAAAATFQPTGITTVTPNAWVISYVCSKDDNALNYNNQNGYSDRMSGASYDTTVGNGSDQAIGVADKEFAAAGAQTCPTWNQSAVGNDAWVALTLALRPITLIYGGRSAGTPGERQMAQLLAT